MNDEILPDGIAVINNEFKIIVFNEAASRITGYQEDFIIGKDCHILFSHAKNSQTKIKEAFSKNISFTNQPLSVTSFEGKIISVLASITPVVKDSEVINIVFCFQRYQRNAYHDGTCESENHAAAGSKKQTGRDIQQQH